MYSVMSIFILQDRINHKYFCGVRLLITQALDIVYLQTLISFLKICSRCTERVFSQHQWQTLRRKLVTWRVSGCLRLLHPVKIYYCYFLVLYGHVPYKIPCILYFFIFLTNAHFQGNIANVISTIRANRITDGSQAMQGLAIRQRVFLFPKCIFYFGPSLSRKQAEMMRGYPYFLTPFLGPNQNVMAIL